MWKSLQHPNVLPLIGATMTETHFAMASEWMAYGNIKQFTKEHPNEDRLGLVGSPLEVPSPFLGVHDDRIIYLA